MIPRITVGSGLRARFTPCVMALQPRIEALVDGLLDRAAAAAAWT